MKTLRYLSALLLFILISNCSNDDDASIALTNESTWNLVKVEGSIAGVTHLFSSGTIQWTFNGDTETLEVVNTNTNEDLFDFYDSGTYSFSFENNGTDDILMIDGVEFGALTSTTNEMIIDQQINDGFVLTFNR